MANYIISRKAIDDLSDIWKYTFDKWSVKQADQYYNQIIKAFESLSINPSLGKIYFQSDVLIKGYKVRRHIIFYCFSKENNLLIIRILHEKMDVKNHIITDFDHD